MIKPHDVILLLQAWTKRPFVVDITQTDIHNEFLTNHTTTDKVHHISEITCTTDACLDSMTVTPHSPNSSTVMVQAGKIQWFEDIIELTAPMESPTLPSFSTKDCDPSIVNPIRWSLLCMKKDTQDYDRLFWAHAVPGEGYPEIPYNGVPLALVKTEPGLVKITKEDIVNWRCIRPGYAPSAKFLFPTVRRQSDLKDYDDPPEGAVCFVLEQGVFYYYQNGAWRRSGAPTFDNTSWYVDITEATPKIYLPWQVDKPQELAVFRDGMFMTLGEDYHVFTGSSSYLMFSYNIMPGKRITVVRNPFFAQAYDDGSGGAGDDPTKYIDLYVDGAVGSDVWDGSQANPFKTLQRAFDVISYCSTYAYRVYAKNLKLEDRVTSDDGKSTCFGWMRDKRMAKLRLYIEPNFEWDPLIMNHVFYLNNCTYILYTGQTVEYTFSLVKCTATFTDTTILGRADFSGGTITMIECDNLGSEKDIHVSDSCLCDIKQCKIQSLNVITNAYVYAYGTQIDNLTISQDGQAMFTYCHFISHVSTSGAYIIMSNCTTTAEGQFIGGWLTVQKMKIDTQGTFTLPLFFKGLQGASFSLYDVNISRMSEHSIVMSHNCMLYMEDGSIEKSVSHGVALDHSCTAQFVHVDFSNCNESGVIGDYSSSLEFIRCTGGGNLRYACECYNISRASFVNSTVWGNLGQYYELFPGSDTVITQRGTDLVAGTLDEKIELGQGLSRVITPSSMPGDYKYRIEIDTDALIGSGGSGSQPLLNLNPKAQVYEHLTQIRPATPYNMIDMQITWPGTSYMSSVTRRVFNPVLQTKKVLTQAATQSLFTEEDKWNGTTMLSDGVTLVDFPSGIGYKPNSPHFFFSNYDGPAALSNFGISKLSGFTVEADVPTGTTLRVAFSVNGSAVWRAWNNSTVEWEILPGESTLIQMQSAPLHTEISGWSSVAWERLRELNGMYITVCFLLTTTSSLLTPKVKSYSWSYTEDGFLEDITEHFDRYYYTNIAIFTYRGTIGNIDPPVYFSVIPMTNRES